MYSVSDAWIKAQNAMISPEGFVEISCYIPELKDTLVFTKRDLMSFSHQQTGSMVSGELPKITLNFLWITQMVAGNPVTPPAWSATYPSD